MNNNNKRILRIIAYGVLYPRGILAVLGIRGLVYLYVKKQYSMNKPNYKKAYEILMEYFDYIPDELKEDVNLRLNEVNC